MSDWKKTKKEYYRKDCCIAYGGGVIDFAPDSMNDVHGGEFKSYDEYLDVQMRSCRQSRNYFELCYYHMGRSADFKGQIERVDAKRGKVIFRRVMVEGMHSDGIWFYGKEDHVWMDIAGFEQYQPGDCVRFTAEIYRYMRRKQGKLIDYALEHPEYISSVASYEVSTDEELIDQQIKQLVCETCRYYDHCFMDMCLANEHVSAEAKLMYGLLLDRNALSHKNGWLDEKNRVYIIYTIEEMRRDLGCATEKIRHVRKYQKAGNERCLKSHRSVPAF